MITADDLYKKYSDVLVHGDLRDVPAGWLGLVDDYFEVVAPLIAGIPFELVSAKPSVGAMDWTWSSPVGAFTEEEYETIIAQDRLLARRSRSTCRVFGRERE